MMTLFNSSWQFAELPLEDMNNGGKPIFVLPDDFFEQSKTQSYKPVDIPHDWMIYHVKDLYKNSVGFYKKSFTLTNEQIQNRHNAIRFEGVYMNSAVWVNGEKAGEWKYGYSTFEFDLTNLVKEGENEILVIAVYQNCNTRWYSGAGIFRDVHFINTPLTYLTTDGTYIVNKPHSTSLKELGESTDEEKLWTCKISVEVAGPVKGHSVITKIIDKDGNIFAKSNEGLSPLPAGEDELNRLHRLVPSLSVANVSKTYEELTVVNPHLWDITDPYFYTATTELLDADGTVIDSISQHCGFKTAVFDKDKGLILNGRIVKIMGACHHHDHGLFGSAFSKNALRRQFTKLKEMGVNSVRCSHNPPPKGWMDLCDELGILVDDEAFDMWEKPKTPFDYGNYFNDWCEKDTASWVRKDRNHPCLLMWSIGNEIYDTHMGNGYEITQRLYNYVLQNDPEHNTPITIASNYMMTDGAQKCATKIDTVGYNYLERLYNEHHEKYPEWKIYGSETASTVQSRGIYHFPETLNLVTFSDGQCSTLGNCSTTWGAPNTQTVITNDRDCSFSAGQYIWTGWDYIGEPTPYHSKNSFFGQIDTAGFPKDTFYLYKSEWAGKNTEPFVHLLPYWDWNENQIIDVKAYTNGESVELFFNGTSLGCQKIDHKKGMRPFGQWQLPYHKGEITAVSYDENGKEIARETKRSFEDPARIIIKPETDDTGNLFFVDLMLADKNGELVENARNYITLNVAGSAELVGMDNGDSTDYEEYVSENKTTHSRKLFANRLVAAIRTKPSANGKVTFVVTAASEGLPTVSIKYDGKNWVEAAPYNAVHPVESFIPSRKIEIISSGSTKLSKENKEITVTAKVLPENASSKEINWNPVLKECVASDNISVEVVSGKGTGTETAIIRATGDGECILRCTAQNGSNYDEVISDLNFTVEGIGNPKLDPYKLIEGCRITKWDTTKAKPTVSLESGITNRAVGATWVGFDKVDFGNQGADTIHIPIFSFDTELPVEIWDGTPDEGINLGTYTYRHQSIYNTFSENVFTLPKRLFGVHTISVAFKTGLEFLGFYFDKTPKAWSKLQALDAATIVGDTFKKTENSVDNIGNNVTLDFTDMEFGEKSPVSVTIYGKSNTDNNSINIKFFGDDGSSQTAVIEFEHTDDWEERTFKLPEQFTLSPLSENNKARKVSFVFLPGCNFDFGWFKFNQ